MPDQQANEFDMEVVKFYQPVCSGCGAKGTYCPDIALAERMARHAGWRQGKCVKCRRNAGEFDTSKALETVGSHRIAVSEET